MGELRDSNTETTRFRIRIGAFKGQKEEFNLVWQQPDRKHGYLFIKEHLDSERIDALGRCKKYAN